MILYMETTKISAEKTAREIQVLLGKYDVNKILFDYENNQITALIFSINYNNSDMAFRLPCRWESIYTQLKKKKKRINNRMNIKLKEQAKRIAWRQILRWIQAQLALINTEMVTLKEVFLPYLYNLKAKQTLYEKLEKTQFKLLEFKDKESNE